MQVRDQLRRFEGFEGNVDQAELVVALEGADSFPPVLEHATVGGATLVLTWNELLDEDSEPGTNTFAATAGNSSREVLDVSVDERTVTLTLDAGANASDTVTVSYTVPSSEDAARIKDATGNAAAGFSDELVTNETTNAMPTGLPVISGAARVRSTLRASVERIADADGLDNAAFEYQWLASDGSDDTEIEGATAATYTLTAAEAGKLVRVRVTFTDDAGDKEVLTSLARAVPAQRPDAPGALVAATADGREGELDVSWTAPANDGGAAVTAYMVQWWSTFDGYGSQQAVMTDPGVFSHRVTVAIGAGLPLGLDRHHRPQHRQALGHRQRRVAPAPVLCLALDALAVGEVPPRIAGPVQPVRGEVHPHALGAHACVVHHLKLHAPPPLEALLVQRRAIPRDHHLTRHRLEQIQQLDMVGPNPTKVPIPP